MKNQKKYLLLMILAWIITIPGVIIRLSHIHFLGIPEIHVAAPLLAFLSGFAVLGASFLLLWACDAVQEDISQMLALAIVALIAVLPEYAVDMYVTYMAGKDPTHYASLAIANMTGANRLIIGLAWFTLIFMHWRKNKDIVWVEKDRLTEILFLGIATIYAIFVAIKGTLEWYDGIVFFFIYGWYVRIAGKKKCEECDVDGPAELLMVMPATKRRIWTAVLFIVAALAIFANAEQFAESLISTGEVLHVKRELLIQWLAPLASEAPEFTVAIMFTLRNRTGVALGSLLSANLNQWTLLVGMIPFVYAYSANTFAHPIPMTHIQMNEIMITAAQSVLGIILIAALRINLLQVSFLLLMFIIQLALPMIVAKTPELFPWISPDMIHPVCSIVYFATAIGILLEHPERLKRLKEGLVPDQSVECIDKECKNDLIDSPRV
jgi:cation:H+ antiporter